MRINFLQITLITSFILLFSLKVFGNMEEYEDLKKKWESMQNEELALEKTCTNPQAPCALTLFDIRTSREDLEKKLKQKEKALGINVKTTKNPIPKIKTENAKDLESSIKKVKKQKKTLKMSAFINAGVGGYLLLNHCSPPAKKVGCVLGPLALSQAYIHYNQSKKMGEIESSLSKIEPLNVNTLTTASTKKTNDSSENDPQLIVNGNPFLR